MAFKSTLLSAAESHQQPWLPTSIEIWTTEEMKNTDKWESTLKAPPPTHRRKGLGFPTKPCKLIRLHVTMEIGPRQ